MQLTSSHPRTRPISAGHLRAFDAVARHLNFRAAAEELSLTQSAVSRQIQALEAGKPATIPVAIAQQLVDMYQAHTQFEETVVLPLADRLLSDNEKEALDLNLRLRHQVANLPSYI